MIRIQRALSDSIIKAAMRCELLGGNAIVSLTSDYRMKLENVLIDALKLRSDALCFLLVEEDELPRNKGSYHQAWIAKRSEVSDIVTNGEWSSFGLIYPETGRSVLIDLGPDYEGSYELSFTEYGNDELTQDITERLKND